MATSFLTGHIQANLSTGLTEVGRSAPRGMVTKAWFLKFGFKVRPECLPAVFGSSMSLLAIVLTGLLSSQIGYAASQTISFSETSSQVSVSGATWNRAQGYFHVPLQNRDWDGGTSTRTFEIGSGQHGAFELSRYSEFSANGDVTGQIIRLDTDIYPVLEVTNFHLAEGWILKPQGSQPLVIRSQGNVYIGGQINCSGENGESGSGLTALGGEGRCGGGGGGAVGQVGSDGWAEAGSMVTGGLTVAGGGGGGGGAFSSFAGSPSSPVAPVRAGPGTNHDDPAFSIIGAGAGGGGGSGNGAGGGGAGGGVVLIYAFGDIYVRDQLVSGVQSGILARGGTGGASTSNGSGGGGGGGSILLFAGSTLTLEQNGQVIVNAGYGTGGASNESGGDGGQGRCWLADSSGVYSAGPMFENPQTPFLPGPGTVEFTAGSYTVESGIIDLANTAPTVTDVTPQGLFDSGDSFTFEIKASDDSFVGDDSGWLSLASASTLGTKRYVKVRITVQSTNSTNPARLQGALVSYQGHEQQAFDFTSACGRLASQPRELALWLVLLCSVYVWLVRSPAPLDPKS